MINEFFENKTNIDKKKNLVLVEYTGVFISQGLPVITNFLNSLRICLIFLSIIYLKIFFQIIYQMICYLLFINV